MRDIWREMRSGEMNTDLSGGLENLQSLLGTSCMLLLPVTGQLMHLRIVESKYWLLCRQVDDVCTLIYARLSPAKVVPSARMH